MVLVGHQSLPASIVEHEAAPYRGPDRLVSRDSDRPASPAPSASPSPSTTPSRPAASPTPRPTPSRPHRPTPSPRPTPPERPERPVVGEESRRFGREVLRLSNEARRESGGESCPALTWNDRIVRAAEGHSQEMAQYGYLGHSSRDGRTPSDRMRAQGYDQPRAENIAAGQDSPAAVFRFWMDSESHRAHILDCEARSLGVAVVRALGPGARRYWTQDFGSS